MQLLRICKTVRRAAVKKCPGQGAGNQERLDVLSGCGRVLPAAQSAEPERCIVRQQVAQEQQAAETQMDRQPESGQQVGEWPAAEQLFEDQANEEQLPEQQVNCCM